MKVLVACEFSGIVRDAFIAKGHDAWSCDLLPTEKEGPHIQDDVLGWLNEAPHYKIGLFMPMRWDLLIAFPPCTYLSRAGARWWKTIGRVEKTNDAARFVFALRDAHIEKIAIENPIGQLNNRWRYPDQTIQPYQFGHPYSKATCLWLKNLPKLVPTNVLTKYTPLLPSNTGWNRKTGQKWHPGAIHSSKEASRTFPGIAQAMANQWG